MPSRAFWRDLERLLPRARLLRSPAGVAPFASDGLTAFAVEPEAVALAESADEVIAVVRACHTHGVPFVARGSGTSLSGGSLPVAGGIVIALNRLDRILRLDPEARVAVVEPGVVNLAVSRAAAVHGLYFAPDPSSQQVCTIGGNVAFNSGGAHCLRHGMTANHVLGLRAVLADGEVVELGGEGLETVGADAVGLFVGSEGLFGIALEITLRLLPRPPAVRTVLAAYDSLEAAGDAVAAVVAAGLLPGAMEIMDALAIEAAEQAVAAGYPPNADAVLIVELEGTPDEVEGDGRRLAEILERSGARVTRTAADEDERAAIWRGRKSAFSAVGRISPDFLVQDGVVPRRRLGEALGRIRMLAERHRLRVANVFHAGDGNLHPLILYDGRVAGELERAEALAAAIVTLCVELGGSITGEHGVGVEKRDFLPALFDPPSIDLMRRLARACDPAGIANRGKMFPTGAPAALGHHGPHPLETAGVLSRM